MDLYEACVGMYLQIFSKSSILFIPWLCYLPPSSTNATQTWYSPAIGTLRSKYVPDENKSVILSLFGIVLNTLVVLAYLFIKELGIGGVIGVSSAGQ